MTIRIRPKPWPWPGDSREEKAIRVALSYRALVQRIAQGRCADPAGDLHRLDVHWQQYGVYWTTPSPVPLDPDDWMPAPELAPLINRVPKDLYNWSRLGRIEQRVGPDGAPEYHVGSVLEYLKTLRQRRAGTRRSAQLAGHVGAT